MPRYYCDYCDTYLTHDSPSVRKQHNAGYKHKANVRTYYQQFEEQQTQSLIDQRIKEHLGQAAAFQVGATFQQHLAARPRLPILPTPVLPVPGIRPPVLPTPVPGAPGYGAPVPQPGMPPVLSSMPPAVSSVPPQMPGMPTRPPPINLPPAPGASAPTSGNPTAAPYQIAAVPTSGAITSNPSLSSTPQGFSAGVPTSTAAVVANTSQDGFPYSQNTPEASQ